MSKTKIIVQKRSFPLLTILFLIFMTLKLTGHISWSWWVISAPLWGPFAIIGIIAGVCGVCMLVVGVACAFVDWRNS